MNWIQNYVRPKIRALVASKDVPDDLWEKCSACEQMIFHRELAENLKVCTHCGYHFRLPAPERLAMLFDEGRFERIPLKEVPHDPLKFKDRERYSERLKKARSKTGEKDALIVAVGKINGVKMIVAAFNFSFMGGSMGVAVGEGLLTAAEEAVLRHLPLLAIPSSGGARMQEGILSLMQLPRSVIAVDMVKEAGLPYMVLLTDPTTGGVSASFAMLGDIAVAEPGAIIGFAGARVIEETIRETLPEGFQRSEYLLDHGMLDAVIARKDLKRELATIADMLMHKDKSLKSASSSKGNGAAKEPVKVAAQTAKQH